MTLDESLTMRDEGLSAYHQRHIKQGALGAFLAAIGEGRIPAGSVLVVEGLDRLSRAEPILAQAQLAQIINADITVVTASDSKQYNREKLKANPMDLVYSLLVMIRAHEESETKSKRVKAAIRRHCETWSADRPTGSRLGRHPQWLQHDGGTWSLVPERAAGIRQAIDRFRRGWGHYKITEDLIAAGLRLGNRQPNSNQLYRLIRNPALMGVKVLEIDGETYRLDAYYPALITPAEFAELQVLMDGRARSGNAVGKLPGILTGIGVAFCGYCGSAMVANNVTTRTRKDGGLAEGNRRLLCACRAARRECPLPSTCAAGPVERAIMTYCADQLNLNALLDGGQASQETALRQRAGLTRMQLTEIDARIERMTTLMLTAEAGDTPAAFVRKARELEAERADIAAELEAIERRLLTLGRTASPAAAEAWAALRLGVEAMDYDARIKARRLIADTFERILIYARGIDADPASGRIDVLLVAKGGGSRALMIERKGGALPAGVAIDDATG